MSAGKGGAGRGQGRKRLDPSDETKRITITLLASQLAQLPENNSEAIRNMIDTCLAQSNRLIVKLFEDNAGGLWLVDTDQEWAHDVSSGESFYQDALALYADDLQIDGESYPYTGIIEPYDDTKLVAEFDGDTVRLYPFVMGHAAKRYCGIV